MIGYEFFAEHVTASILSSVFHPSLHVAFGVALGDGVTLVVVLFAAAEADLQLGPAVLVYVHAKGDQGHALKGQGLIKFPDLLLVEEEPADPGWLHVKAVPLLVRGNVHAVDHGLAGFDLDEGLLDGDLAGADGLDLGARQLDARLVGLVHEIVVVGFFVVGC